LGRNKILDKLGYSLFGNITFTSNNVICHEEKKLDASAISAMYIFFSLDKFFSTIVVFVNIHIKELLFQLFYQLVC
jgi:hypothetical protein